MFFNLFNVFNLLIALSVLLVCFAWVYVKRLSWALWLWMGWVAVLLLWWAVGECLQFSYRHEVCGGGVIWLVDRVVWLDECRSLLVWVAGGCGGWCSVPFTPQQYRTMSTTCLFNPHKCIAWIWLTDRGSWMNRVMEGWTPIIHDRHFPCLIN